MSLEPRLKYTCDDAPEADSPLYRKGYNVVVVVVVVFSR